MYIIDIALKNGFKFTSGRYPDVSTMIPNGIRCRLDHPDGRFIIWGLNEHGKPPTLCYPRPLINKHTIFEVNGKQYPILLTEQSDDCINELMRLIPHEEIFEQMFLQSKTYNLNSLTEDK